MYIFLSFIFLSVRTASCDSFQSIVCQMPVYSVKAHSEIINCIDGVGGLGIGLGAPEIVTGSRDGLYISQEFTLRLYHSSHHSILNYM